MHKQTNIIKMKKIRQIIDTAPTKTYAINMLNTMQIFGNITESQYKKGKELITKEFQN
jgi:hypothetical protein